jgi:Cu/Ag efflux protein CusF
MRKHIALYAIVAAALMAAPAIVGAQTNSSSTTAAAPAKKKKTQTASGKVTVVDTNAMTLTAKDLTFNITSTTKILKDEKPATLAEIKAGDKVKITYKKDDAGKLAAATIHDSEKAAADPKAAK